MTADSLLGEVLLSHRAPGHLRFELPATLCRAEIAHYLEQGLHQLEGVRRVVVYTAQRKLSVFYQETVVGVHGVVRKLARLIDLLEQRRLAAPPAPPKRGLIARLREARPLARVQQRYHDWRERARQVSAVAKIHWKFNPALRLLGDDPEKAVFGFINDAVTFYLIKVHWDLIVGKWLKRPIKHRYEWLTAFYFVFLLVRSWKKPGR
ncbi:hypothetical protein [Endothiovibrio diazotrophicus]